MKNRKQSDRKRGASRMRQQGYRGVTVWLSPGEWEGLRRAADVERVAVATLARALVLEGVVREQPLLVPAGFAPCSNCPVNHWQGNRQDRPLP